MTEATSFLNRWVMHRIQLSYWCVYSGEGVDKNMLEMGERPVGTNIKNRDADRTVYGYGRTFHGGHTASGRTVPQPYLYE